MFKFDEGSAPRRLVVAGLGEGLEAELRGSVSPPTMLVRFRDIDPDDLLPARDVIATGRSQDRSVGDHGAIREAVSRRLAVLLVLSADDQVQGALRGLGMICDVIVAPVGPQELGLRLSQLVVRATDANEAEEGGLTIDHAAHEVLTDHGAVHLTPREYAVVAALARACSRPVTRDGLARACEQLGSIVDGRGVDVIVARLRRKLGRHAAYLETLRGVGYRLRQDLLKETRGDQDR